MADVLTHIDTLDVEVNFDNAPQDISAEEQATDGIQVGAQPEQLLSLIGANERLAATNAKLVDEVLPAFRGGLQTKEVAPADVEQVVTPDDGYLGLQRVKVAPYEREVQVVNRRANESEYLYYMEDIATQYQRSDYAVAMAGEFYKNADTTILAGADAYLTSDGDFYTSQTTHTWHDDDDMHANRWVVYYFKEGENKSNFMIADASACPTVLAVKGHLGAIIANIAVSIRDIITIDDSTILDIRIVAADWDNNIVLGKIKDHNGKYIFYNNSRIKLAIVYTSSVVDANIAISCPNLIALYLPNLTTTSNAGSHETTSTIAQSCKNLRILSLPNLESAYGKIVDYCDNVKILELPKLRVITSGGSPFWCGYTKTLYLPAFEESGSVVLFYDKSQQEIIAPNFRKFTGSRMFQPGADVVITKIVFGSMTSFGLFSWNKSPFVKLIHFEFGADRGAGLSVSANVSVWTCSAIDLTADDLVEDKDKFTTNKEQLLYNFKTYTIERLQNRTDMSKLTLTIGTYLYNIVTQETDDSLTDGVPYGEWLTAKLAEINWSLASA